MIRAPTGLRWSCHSCGACCTGHDLGPVAPEVVAGLERADIRAAWAPAADGFVDARPDGAYLRQRDGACVFLEPDRRCAVHRLLGEQAKPAFCREFPYHLIDDPLGTVAVVRATCAGFWRSYRDGEIQSADALAAVAAVPATAPRARFAPASVPVAPGVSVDLSTWMRWEDATLRAAMPDDDPRDAIARIRRGWTGDLPAPRPAQYDAAFDALTFALSKVLDAVLAQPGGAPHQVAFVEGCADALALARQHPPAPLDADARAWLDLLLRSALLAKSWAAWGGVAEGLGVWLLGVEVARRRPTDAALTAEDLAPAIARWDRFVAIGVIGHWLRKARVAAVDLTLHA